MSQAEIEELAEWLHSTYEKTSRARNWKTQKKCQVKFWDLPRENRLVMLDVAAHLLTKYRKK